jgi:hypothetical protein
VPAITALATFGAVAEVAANADSRRSAPIPPETARVARHARLRASKRCGRTGRQGILRRPAIDGRWGVRARGLDPVTTAIQSVRPRSIASNDKAEAVRAAYPACIWSGGRRQHYDNWQGRTRERKIMRNGRGMGMGDESPRRWRDRWTRTPLPLFRAGPEPTRWILIRFNLNTPQRQDGRHRAPPKKKSTGMREKGFAQAEFHFCCACRPRRRHSGARSFRQRGQA